MAPSGARHDSHKTALVVFACVTIALVAAITDTRLGLRLFWKDLR